MINMLFSFFLLSFTFTTHLLAMDPPPIKYNFEEYTYYRSKEGKIFRCPKRGDGAFECFNGGQWHSDSSIKYNHKNNEYSYWFSRKVHVLMEIAKPSQERQVIGRGGPYQRTMRGGPSGPTLADLQKSQGKKMTLPGKNDFGKESIEEHGDYIIHHGFGQLICKRPLEDNGVALLLEMCKREESEWKVINIIANGDTTLNHIVEFIKEKLIEEITLEMYNISEAAMNNLAKFLQESPFLVRVTIVAPQSPHAELVIREIVREYSLIPHLEFSMPFDNPQSALLLEAFLNNSKLGSRHKLEISNHKIDMNWFKDLKKHYESKGLIIQHSVSSERQSRLSISKR